MCLPIKLLLAIQIISTTGGDIFTTTPNNLAIVAGESLRLECGVAHNLTILWYYHAANIKPALIYNGENFSNNFVSDFSVDKSIAGQRALMATNARLKHSGVYECRVLEGANFVVQTHSAKAQLIVLASDPVCWSNLSSQHYVAAEFDSVWIQCDLNYTGRWLPTMEWVKQIQNISYVLEIVPTELSNVQYVFSFVIMQVDADDNGAVINFKTYFASAGNQVTTNASNIPDYVYNWNITLNVEYGPRNITIMPVLDSYEPGCRLVCQADANPSPDYRWKDIETSSIVDGSEITIRKSVKEQDTEYLYVCVAENIVRGYKLSASSEFSVKVKGNVWLVIRGYIFGLIGVVAGIAISFVVFKFRLRIRAISQNGSEQRKTISDSPVEQLQRDSIRQPVDQYQVMIRRPSLDTINEGSPTPEHETTSLYEVIGTITDTDQPNVYYNLPPT